MEKINICELLKDCPQGMELDCTNYSGVVTFEKITDNATYPIKIEVKCGDEYFTHTLTKYGQTCKTPYNKCIIFPKGKTTWEGFQKPFKDGDIVVCEDDGKINQMFILKSQINNNRGYCYIGYDFDFNKFFNTGDWHFDRLATEEEKQKLFDAIKANGYRWNAETKTLERINKFDITTLKAFDKVLTRDNDNMYWAADIYSHHLGKDKNYQFLCISVSVKQCIPYEENKHLLGTTNDCDEYYKTWE